MRTTKSHKFDVRCTPEQFLAFSQLADRRGMGLGTLARTLLLREVIGEMAEPKPEPKGTPTLTLSNS